MVVRHKTVALLLHCRSPIRYPLAHGIGRFITQRHDWSVRWLWSDVADAETPTSCDGAVVVSDDVVTAARFASIVPHCVITGCEPPNDAVAAVYCDPVKVGQMAAEHFCDLGYQSLAFLGVHTAADDMRWRGFWEAARKYDVLPVIHQLPMVDSSQACCADHEIKGWITNLPRKTGIFVTDDRRAANLCELAREADLTVPQDLAVISLGHDRDATSFARPRLSFVDVPWEHLGFQAAELLSGILAGQPPRQIVVDPNRVVQRASTQSMAVDDEQIARPCNSFGPTRISPSVFAMF